MSSFGDQKENSSSSAELRQDARFRVTDPEAYKVFVTMGHSHVEARCVDYSPFGLGLRFKMSSELPLFSIGELVELQCEFVGSRFHARGAIANTRVERLPEGDFVRLGISLSRSAEVVRPAHVKRRSARILMNEGVSPLVFVHDELRFGDAIFAKITDISSGGMRLIIDRHPLPFLEKQKHWFEIVLPIFGQARAYCRIAYVRKEEGSNRYMIGCEFISGGTEQNLRAIEDWLFYCNLWISVSDIKSAGFPLAHLGGVDESYRVLVSSSNESPNSGWGASLQAEQQDNGVSVPPQLETIEFSVSESSRLDRIVAVVEDAQRVLNVVGLDVSAPALPVLTALWKSILLFALHNGIQKIVFNVKKVDSPFISGSFAAGWNDKSQTQSFGVHDLFSGGALRFALWRRVYSDLSRKNDMWLPRPSSLIRKIMLF
ncbi:MAG: hypothetical protein RIR26_2133 [Pseudomonadota bacterium]|jgi:hypothetical protein